MKWKLDAFMSKNSQGPILVITKNLIDDTYRAILAQMVDKKLIQPSVKTIIEHFKVAHDLANDHVDENNVYIRAFLAFELLKGKRNPDLKSNADFKFAYSTKYKRLAELTDLGFLTKLSQPPEHYKDAPRALKFYKLSYPSLDSLLPLPEKDETHKTKEAAQARKVEFEINAQMAFSYADTQLQRMGSYEFLSNFLNRCIRPDAKTKIRLIQNEFNVPVPNESAIGQLTITTSALETSDIIIAEDMILVDYVLSVILEKLEDSEGLTLPIENRFRFDFATILADFDTADSGGYRDILSNQFDRIFGTDFHITASPKTLWLMEKLGFVDNEGKPYDNVSIRLLSQVGQKNMDLPNDVAAIINQRKVARYIDLSLPNHLIQQINKSLEKGHRKLVPMFSRDKHLIQQNSPGIPWLLNSFLSQKCPRPGFKYGAVELKGFCKLWMRAWESKEESVKGVLSILNMLRDQSRLLYVEGLTLNSRKQPRLNLMFAKIDKFLIRIENTTPEKMQLGVIKYAFLGVRMTDAEIRIANERLELVKQDAAYAEDEIYKKIGMNIVAKADIEAKQYKKTS